MGCVKTCNSKLGRKLRAGIDQFTLREREGAGSLAVPGALFTKGKGNQDCPQIKQPKIPWKQNPDLAAARSTKGVGSQLASAGPRLHCS